MDDRAKRAFDRGSADAYYGRPAVPHLWLDKLGKIEIGPKYLTDSEKIAYYEGYDTQIDRKEWE